MLKVFIDLHPIVINPLTELATQLSITGKTIKILLANFRENLPMIMLQLKSQTHLSLANFRENLPMIMLQLKSQTHLSKHQNLVVDFNAIMRSLFPSCFKGKSSEILFRTGQGAIAFKKKRMEKRSLF
jgi:hypothetical protein